MSAVDVRRKGILIPQKCGLPRQKPESPTSMRPNPFADQEALGCVPGQSTSQRSHLFAGFCSSHAILILERFHIAQMQPVPGLTCSFPMPTDQPYPVSGQIPSSATTLFHPVQEPEPSSAPAIPSVRPCGSHSPWSLTRSVHSCSGLCPP